MILFCKREEYEDFLQKIILNNNDNIEEVIGNSM